MTQPFAREFDDYNFPDEPKKFAQWVVCYANKIPLYSPGYQQPLIKASPVDPATWMSYETALHLCEANEGLLPGFVLTPDDPFSVIDMDIKNAANETDPSKHTTPEIMQWFQQIVYGAQSYAEMSASGKGMHLWVYGNMGEGRRSSAYDIERYSQERFIICTGNDATGLQITHGNGVLDYLDQFLKERTKVAAKIEDKPQEKTDQEIIDEITDWTNADKFQELMYLPLSELRTRQNFLSGSEADAALLNFLCKASPNNAQVMRLFRTTPLANRGPKPGQKDKIMANDSYLLRTINNFRSMLQVETMRKDAEREALIAQSTRNIAAMQENMEREKQVLQQQIAVNDAKYDIEKTGYGWPPGPIGEIAKWIYSTSTLPVEVISITTTLAIASALTAKGWKFLDKHLNAFYIIAARSGTGKNAMHQGIGRIVKLLDERALPSYSLFGASDMRSTIAWRKKLIEQVNYCQIMPEIGAMLEDLNNANNPHAGEKKQFLLNAYSAAQEGVMSGGAEYSNKENNVASKGTELTLTLIGETTLESLYKNLTGKLAADGFMSRFNYGVYEGYTVDRNFDTKLALPTHYVELLAHIFSQGEAYKMDGTCFDIPMTEAARVFLRKLESSMKEKLGNEGKMEDETLRQIYNRIQERIERMAGTFAVFRNPSNPIVDMIDLEWPYAYIMSSTQMFLTKYKAGEIGEMSDLKVRRVVASAIMRYFAADLDNSKAEMRYIPHQQRKIFLRSSIQSRCYNQLARLETARICEKPGRALWRILSEFTSEGLIRPLTDGDRTVLMTPQDGSQPIEIDKTTDAWFITNLEGLKAICDLEK